MRPATRLFIKQRFTDYYNKTRISAPSSVREREFGFIFFDERYPDDIWMRRHIGFSSGEEMQDYVRSIVPAHAYYSTAYYQNPHAPTMGDKEWLGADLIFDLDADHIMHGSYEEMLSRIKEEAIKLLDVLDNELGIDMRTIKLVFSGGRGYHVHVQELAMRDFEPAERRELVSYICGIGISPSALLSDWAPGRAGWHERFRVLLTSYLQDLSKKPEKDVKAELSSLRGVGQVMTERFYKMIPELVGLLKTDPSSILFRDQTVKTVFGALASERESRLLPYIRKAAVQVDEPVSTDIRRLIRLPDSLHAKSGFKVVPLEVKELNDFDPLIDAVAFGDREIIIESDREYSFSLLGSRYDIPKGRVKVPEAAGLFLCCRGIGEIGGSDHAS
ncbi:MAG TPA: DNA primase small subunit PriS [Methanospirillum sp.]|jgi:DNA primase small subunit|uniref:DNA primase small subunit domain-containing protein n=1 Tax=Methanospirillum sp. TaxID=45200 RepID=UPI0009CA0759|nr:DNA primase small subunit PriS [Methanospirillum sp.]OQB39195.1 MAG: DNA primase small subunit PriS [Euryarchaeota archaeon ADurb.Bin165]HPY59298.1 DNA primase small subunit PriS [Methanospirillum sp.]